MKNKTSLIIGDILAMAIVTYIGFITHGEGGLSYLSRMAAVFFPLVIGWFLIAPWFGLFTLSIVSDLKMLWRPILAVIFAAPMALVLRGLFLNAPVLPIFAVVFASTSAFGLVIWRAVYLFFVNRK